MPGNIARKVAQALGYMKYMELLGDGWYFGVLVEVSLCSCHQCLCVVGTEGPWKRKQWVSRGNVGESVRSVSVQSIYLCGIHFTDFHPERRAAYNPFSGYVIAPGLPFPEFFPSP